MVLSKSDFKAKDSGLADAGERLFWDIFLTLKKKDWTLLRHLFWDTFKTPFFRTLLGHLFRTLDDLKVWFPGER